MKAKRNRRSKRRIDLQIMQDRVRRKFQKTPRDPQTDHRVRYLLKTFRLRKTRKRLPY